jgi:hypothetical protein
MRIIRDVDTLVEMYPKRSKKPRTSLVKYPLNANVNSSVWGQSKGIFEDTLHYLDIIKAKVYIIIVEGGRMKEFVKFSPIGRPEGMKIRYNEKLNWTVEERKRLEGNIDVMNCVIHPDKKEVEEEHMYERIMGRVSERYILPDGAYVFSLRDAVLIRKDGYHPYVEVMGRVKMEWVPSRFVPVFNTTGHIDYLDIAIPTYDDFMYVRRNEPDLSKAVLDFGEKKSVAIFRGGATGCGYTSTTNMRIKIAKMGMNPSYKRILDAGITVSGKRYRYDPIEGLGYFSHMLSGVPPIKPVPKIEQSSYKYVVYIAGNVAAYRLPIDMQLGSVILLVDSPFKVWIEEYMKAWEHYVPIKGDLSDLIEKIKWCKDHEDECAKIAERGYELSKSMLQEENLYANIGSSMRVV